MVDPLEARERAVDSDHSLHGMSLCPDLWGGSHSKFQPAFFFFKEKEHNIIENIRKHHSKCCLMKRLFQLNLCLGRVGVYMRVHVQSPGKPQPRAWVTVSLSSRATPLSHPF